MPNNLTRRLSGSARSRKTLRGSTMSIEKQLYMILKSIATIAKSDKYAKDVRMRAQLILGFLCAKLFIDPCDGSMKGGAHTPPAAGAAAAAAAAAAAPAAAPMDPRLLERLSRLETADAYRAAASHNVRGGMILSSGILLISLVLAFIFGPSGVPAGTHLPAGMPAGRQAAAMSRSLARMTTGVTPYVNAGFTPAEYFAPAPPTSLIPPYALSGAILIAGILGALYTFRMDWKAAGRKHTLAAAATGLTSAQLAELLAVEATANSDTELARIERDAARSVAAINGLGVVAGAAASVGAAGFAAAGKGAEALGAAAGEGARALGVTAKEVARTVGIGLRAVGNSTVAGFGTAGDIARGMGDAAVASHEVATAAYRADAAYYGMEGRRYAAMGNVMAAYANAGRDAARILGGGRRRAGSPPRLEN